MNQWLLVCGLPAALVVMWTVLAVTWPMRSRAAASSGFWRDGAKAIGRVHRHVDGRSKKTLAILLVAYASSNAFAGRDGAQVVKQESENKRVAAERKEPCELSGRRLTSQTLAHGERLFSLPGECGLPRSAGH